jgi:hypothetical protein
MPISKVPLIIESETEGKKKNKDVKTQGTKMYLNLPFI